jgi:hypothetical protein
MNTCAPGVKYENNSCFTTEDLMKIAEEYNNTHDTKIIIKNDRKYLLVELNRLMSMNYKCNDELCWIDTKFIKKMKNIKIEDIFRPVGPTPQFEWLSTTDIDSVMEQYEKQFKNFKFFGAVPYDFRTLPEIEELYNINFNKLVNSNKNILGMVINLDDSTKPGSHWVALYAVLNENKIYYFDSVGNRPGKRVRNFNKEIFNYMRNNNNNKLFDIRYNHIKHQSGGSECGVYSMNFLIRLLNGESFDHIVNTITKDDKINKCRSKYFRNKSNNHKGEELEHCTLNS